jgi:hypothetical protein
LSESFRWVIAISLIVGGSLLALHTNDFSAPPTDTQLLIANIFRYVTLVAGSIVVGLTVLTVSIYASVFALYLRRYGRHDWRGLLPRHVITISISYTMMIVGSIVDIAIRVDEPITWRTPVYLLTYLLGAWAMWDVLGHSRHRYCEATADVELS